MSLYLNLKHKENQNSITHKIIEDDDIMKYRELYNQILNYFNCEKPYSDPDFNISLLANALNSNVTYISRAIKLNTNTNFSIFINTYRIQEVKNLIINENYHNKYNLKYIYSSVGFRHQSTFNKAFKQIESITPSEYLKEIGKNHYIEEEE